jgi:hypothetical protein
VTRRRRRKERKGKWRSLRYGPAGLWHGPLWRGWEPGLSLAWHCLTLLTPPQDTKAPKKKREPPKDLRHDPPILQVVGHGTVMLEPLLVGEPVVSTVCNFGVVRTPEYEKLILARVQWGPSMPFCICLCPPHRELAGQGRTMGQVRGLGARGGLSHASGSWCAPSMLTGYPEAPPQV